MIIITDEIDSIKRVENTKTDDRSQRLHHREIKN